MLPSDANIDLSGFLNIANYFTLGRLLIGPLFLCAYTQPDWLGLSAVTLPYLLLTLLTLSELSDVFDGYLARRYNQVTDFGKIVDPMADSICRMSIFITYTLPPVNLPVLLILVFIYRDSVVSTLRTLCALKGYALAAQASGKIKAAIQATAAISVALLLIPFSLGMISQETLSDSATLLVSLAGAYTLYSGLVYVYAHRHYIALVMSKRPACNQGRVSF